MAVTVEASLIFKAFHSKISENVSGALPHVFDALSLVRMADGTGTLQCDRVVSDRRTLASAGTEDLDLQSTLLDVYGAAVVFAKVRWFILYNRSTAQTFAVKPGASNGWLGMLKNASDILEVPPGGSVIWYAPAGIAVGASTKIMAVTNSSGVSADYDLYVAGNSA